MESITVFEVNEENIELGLSSKEIQYNELAEQGILSKHHFDNLLLIEDVLAKKAPPDTNIVGVLARYVAQYCLAIIADETKNKYSVQAQFDEVLPVIKSPDAQRKIYIPKGTQISIVGFKIPAVFIRRYNENILIHDEHLSHTDISDSGRYVDYNMDTLRYLAQRPEFTHPGHIPIEAVVLFESEEHAKKILLRIMEYIKYIERFYSTTFPHVTMDFEYIEQEPLKPFKPVKIESSAKPSATDLDLEIVNQLKGAIEGKFGTSYAFDVLYTLDSNGILFVYNLGVFDELSQFKKLKSQKEAQIAYQLDYNRQVIASYTYQNMLSKKRNIAIQKYGIDDLNDLTPQQMKIVDLEYKKTAITDDSKDVSRAFYRLSRSFEDADNKRLSEAISTIEKLVSAKQLSSYDILPGGFCPHVYAKGKVTLENFNKPWLQTKILEKMIEYSLPSDISGYFCKICGEKLAETDRAQSLTFSGDKNTAMYSISDTADDPLQSMIWKEAMYIISSNVRFKDPIPIKPLVASLAIGLRPVIAAEETKLYRSKTTAQEVIKDTLNLYAAIYIYASVCALMYHNPGRMVFARDKPSESKEGKVAQIEQKTEQLRQQKNEQLRQQKNEQKPKENRENRENREKNELRSSLIDSDNEQDEQAEQADDEIEESEYTKNTEESEYIKDTKDQKEAPMTNQNSSNLGSKSALSKVRRFGIKGQGTVKGRSEQPQESNKKMEAIIVKNAIILLILSKETIITRIKTMSIPIIKSVFSAAYKWALMHAKPIHVDRDVTRQIEMDPIVMLPLYNYIHTMKRMEFFSGKSKFAPGFNDVPHVIGVHREAALKAASNGESMWKNVKVELDTSKLSKIKGYADYAKKSFEKELEYVRDGIFRQPVVPLDIRMKEFRESLEDLRKFDRQLKTRMVKQKAGPHAEIPLNDNIALLNDYDPRKIDLAKHYCDNGQKHSLSIFVYSDGKTQHEAKKSDIVNWLEKKTPELEKFANWEYINDKCDKCNKLVRTAESNKKSMRALADMFGKIDDITAFYSYYDSRCPSGNLHEFVSFGNSNDKKSAISQEKRAVSAISQQCKACGFETKFSRERDEKYYEKWRPKFLEVQREKLELAIKSIEDLAALPAKSPPRPKVTYQYTLKHTAEWSKILNIPYNTIVNIGLTEGVYVNDISEAKINPSKEDYFKKTRGLKLKSYILDTLRLYSNLLESDNIIVTDKEIADLAAAAKKAHPGLFDVLPKFNNFVEKDETHKYLPLDDYVNFLQEYLAGIMVSINNIEQKYKAIGMQIIKLLTNRIMAKETFFSKPIPFFFKIDITSLEDSEEEGVSGDDWANAASSSSESEFAEENEVETYENEINNDGFDVEEEGAIWEVE